MCVSRGNLNSGFIDSSLRSRTPFSVTGAHSATNLFSSPQLDTKTSNERSSNQEPGIDQPKEVHPLAKEVTLGGSMDTMVERSSCSQSFMVGEYSSTSLRFLSLDRAFWIQKR